MLHILLIYPPQGRTGSGESNITSSSGFGLLLPRMNISLPTKGMDISILTLHLPQGLITKLTGYLLAMVSEITATGHGAMSGMQIIGDAGSGQLDVDKYSFLANSSGVSAGFVDVPLNPTNLVSKPSKNPKITVTCFCSTTNLTRQYVGWSSASSIPVSDTPLANTDVGVIVGFRSTDANYTIINNDGLGAPHITALPIAKDTLVHTISISLSINSIVCSVDSSTVIINTGVPDTNLNLFIEGQAV